MSKIRVAVIMGGPSSEHDISMRTGQCMLQRLDNEKYEVLKIVINKSGTWTIGDNTKEIILGEALDVLESQVDVALLALHGTFGEDGTIQALLELRDIAYTGSSAGASLLAMDKITSAALYESVQLTVPRSLHCDIDTVEEAAGKITKNFTLPVVVKPVRQGSSVGVHIVKEEAGLLPALKDALLYDQRVIAQQHISGREISCGVLENSATGMVTALPPTELIVVASEFFDYHAKYTPGATREVTPPDMEATIIADIQDVALRAHRVLGCGSYSRTDMIVTPDDIYVIETNTLPGMTETSILPQQAEAADMSFSELLDCLIDNANKGSK